MTIRNNALYAPLCALVAREAELETVLECWRASRLVTLFGVSGVGKSVLAQSAAAKLAAERPEPVLTADASGARTGTAVLRLLARVRRRASTYPGDGAAKSGSEDPARRRGLFLLLDDLPVTAHVAARGLLQWLVVNPDVHLLVVSRWPLELLGEQALPLPPLAVAGKGTEPTPACTLLTHYARRARPGSPPPDPALAAELCLRFEGLPAALEATAGLLGAVPDADILRLAGEQPLSLSLRGQPLLAQFAATWGDLPAAAREYLVHQAVWPPEGNRLAPAEHPGPGMTAGSAARLVQIGLISRDEESPGRGGTLSRLMGAWIHASGAAHTPAQQARRARAVLQSITLGPGPRPPISEIRWAWRWQVGQRDPASFLQMARLLAGPLRREMGVTGEACELLESALIGARATGGGETACLESQLAATEVTLGRLDEAEVRLNRLLAERLPRQLQARTLLRLATLLTHRGQMAAARDRLETALSILRTAMCQNGGRETESVLAWALQGLSEIQRRLGDAASAWMAIEESLALFERLDSPAGRAAALATLGLLHADRGELNEARQSLESSRAYAVQARDLPAEARACQRLGRVAETDGSAALELAQAACAMWERMDRPADLAASLLDLADVALAPEARAAAGRALRIARQHGYRALEAGAWLWLTEDLRRAGRFELAEANAPEIQRLCGETDDALLRQRCASVITALAGAPSTSLPTASVPPWCQSGPAPRPEAPLLIRLLGPFTVEGPEGILAVARLRPKEQRILARLALEPGQVVSRDELLELFWSHSSAVTAERSLRTVVSSLRGALRTVLVRRTERVIRGRFEGYCLESEGCAVDADQFAAAIRAARAASSESPPPAAALATWRQAYEWYRGDLLGAFMYEDWCLTARERLRNDFLDALYRLAGAALERGSPEEARGMAARMVEIDPTEERAHRLLMRGYALLGRPAEALRQFARCRAALWDELGAQPSAATLSLLEAIRAGAAPDMREQDGMARAGSATSEWLR